MRLRDVTIVVAVLAALIAGCGDDDETTTAASTAEPTTTTAPGLEKFQSGGGTLPDDFAARVSAICEEGQAAVEQVYLELGSSADVTALSEAVSEQIVPVIQRQIDDIGALGEPDEGADELSRFLKDAQTALNDVEQSPSSLLTQEPFAEVGQQAARLGVPACAV